MGRSMLILAVTVILLLIKCQEKTHIKDLELQLQDQDLQRYRCNILFLICFNG